MNEVQYLLNQKILDITFQELICQKFSDPIHPVSIGHSEGTETNIFLIDVIRA